MIELLIIPLYGITNALRGSGTDYTPKWALSVLLGVFMWFTTHNYQISIIIALGFLMGFSKGWTHKALHGWNDNKVKFQFISTIVNKFLGKQVSGDKWWGVLFMTIYALLMQYPQFLTLSFVTHSITPLLWGLGVLLFGLIQYIIGVLFWKIAKDSTLRIFEFTYGCFIGTIYYLGVF